MSPDGHLNGRTFFTEWHYSFGIVCVAEPDGNLFVFFFFGNERVRFNSAWAPYRMRDDSAENGDPVPDGSILQIDGMLLFSGTIVLLVLIIKVMQYFIAANIGTEAVCHTPCSMDNVSCQTDFSAKHLTGMEEELKKHEVIIRELKTALEEKNCYSNSSLREMIKEYSIVLDCQTSSNC